MTEFSLWDHLVPHDLGGPTTEENIQRLCPTCNTSKGNKVQCRKCGHWMTPDKSRCSQCETPLLYTKYSKTFNGRLERLFQKVVIAAVIGIAGLALLLFLTGGLFLAFYFVGNRSDADGAATVNTIVNDSFTALSDKPTNFKVVIPRGARNLRIVAGFKVTAGSGVKFYIVNEDRFAEWSAGAAKAALTQREQTNSNKIRQSLQPGTYYLSFTSPDPFTEVKVAAEFYAKYD